MKSFEYISTLNEYINSPIISFSWYHDDLKLSSIPIYVKTSEELELRIICSNELSILIRDYDAEKGFSASSLMGSVSVDKKNFDLSKYFVIRVSDRVKSYIRLSCVIKSRTI
jgi:hypothetical protein